MVPAEDLFVYCYVLVDDLIDEGMVRIPRRPGPAPACTDKGFNGAAVTEPWPRRASPTWCRRPEPSKTMPKSLQKIIAEWRNRIETTVGELTDTMELARHGAHTFHGLPVRTAAHTIAKIALPTT